jgi:hypothetical protein
VRWYIPNTIKKRDDMKNIETITALALAVGAASVLYFYSKRKKETPKTPANVKEVLGSEVVKAETYKYSSGLREEYDIVIPHAYPAKKVREKAEQVSKDRHAINPKKRQYPIFLHEL